MAATEIATTSLVDFSTAAYAAGLELGEEAAYDTLVSGAGNGVKFDFNASGFMVLFNDSASTRTFTIPLEEPAAYTAKGITFTDKTVVIATQEKHLLPVDSRYAHADGYVYVEASGADCKIQVTKRYTVV